MQIVKLTKFLFITVFIILLGIVILLLAIPMIIVSPVLAVYVLRRKPEIVKKAARRARTLARADGRKSKCDSCSEKKTGGQKDE